MNIKSPSLLSLLLLLALLVLSSQQGCSVALSDAGCTSCNISGCITCSSGYYLAANKLCFACNPGCQTCSNLMTCTSCATGYYLNGTVCYGCTQPCSSCTNGTVCLSCPPAFYLSSTVPGQCYSCADYNCVNCTGTGLNCTECAVGFYIFNAVCTQCPYYSCATCNNSTAHLQSPLLRAFRDVLAMPAGMPHLRQRLQLFLLRRRLLLNNSQCQFCIAPSCKVCTSTANCVKCIDQYFYNEYVCIVCPSNCYKCINGSYCVSCMPLYYLNSSNNCQSPGSNCIGFLGGIGCVACPMASYRNGLFCTACPASCTACTATDSVAPVVSKHLYLSQLHKRLFSAGACKTCTTPNCINCNAGTCIYCAIGYMIRRLFAHFAATQSRTALPAAPSAAALLAMAATIFQALAAISAPHATQPCPTAHFVLLPRLHHLYQQRYYLDGPTCKLCNNIITGCVTCNYGPMAMSVSPALQDFSSPAHTATIAPSTTLVAPSAQYLSALLASIPLETSAGYALPAPFLPHLQHLQRHCLSLLRADMYMFNNSCYGCSNAIPNCNTCSSGTNCTSCTILAYLNGTSCTSCNVSLQGCSSCLNSSYCISCVNSSYYFANGSCIPCATLPACVTCNSAPNCTACNSSSYYVQSGICTLCSSTMPNCVSCSSLNHCSACVNQSYLPLGYGGLAISGCISCSNSTTALHAQMAVISSLELRANFARPFRDAQNAQMLLIALIAPLTTI
ncbi:uncharacterized protein LOC116245620 [Nymphaea colorata]|uniref:uncharacterized protein LOC116245620 n=1 Tax=Nymphaea colorata TaxID=210225 RepID=UPI00129EDD9E|nr:uncharacterized protein LOC116245620 [Nymphaea colorata]